jgi:hypothetical protein
MILPIDPDITSSNSTIPHPMRFLSHLYLNELAGDGCPDSGGNWKQVLGLIGYPRDAHRRP